MYINFRKQILVLILGCLGNSVSAHADTSNDWETTALQYIQAKQPQLALSILQPKMDTLAGNTNYDLLLSTAAMENQQPNLAVFALERVVLTSPDLTSARFSLAKAYIQLGENVPARQELHTIISRSKNEKYIMLSNELLNTIKNEKRYNFSVFVTAGLGNDSNVNSATSSDTFLGVNLAINSQAVNSPVSTVGLNGTQVSHLGHKLDLVSRFNLFKNQYSSMSSFDTVGTNLSSRLVYKTSGSMHDSLGISYNRYDVGNKLNNYQTALQLTHLQKIAPHHSLNLSSRIQQTRYESEYSIKDVNQFNGGIQYEFGARRDNGGLVIANLGAITGKDEPLHTNHLYKRRYTGAQTGLVVGNDNNHVLLSANLHYVSSEYSTPFFGTSRKDYNTGASLKLDLKLGKKWQVSPTFSYAKNHSSVALYNYERTQIVFNVSHQII